MTKYIEMCGKHGDGKILILDDIDYDLYLQWNWHVDRRGYLVRNMWIVNEGKRKCITIQFHVEVNKTPSGFDTDHKNRNRLDNRRKNLRTATELENSNNSGKRKSNKRFKGVYKQTMSERFLVMFDVHKRHECWGTYDTEEFAAHVHDYIAYKYHGDWAYLNFPNEIPSEDYNPDNCRIIRYKNR